MSTLRPEVVINTGVRFRKRGETIDLRGWAGSACLSAVLARGWGMSASVRRETSQQVSPRAELALGGVGGLSMGGRWSPWD